MDDAVLGRGAAPFPLRQFLLATGERGLGWEAVRRITSSAEFTLLEYLQTRVLQSQTDDGKRAIRLDQAAEAAVALEHAPVAPPPVIDPETATPAEVAAWQAAMRRGGWLRT